MTAALPPEMIDGLDALEEVADQNDVRVNQRVKQGKRSWAVGSNIHHGAPARAKPAKPPGSAPIAATDPPADPKPVEATVRPIFEFANYETMREAFRAARVMRGLSNARSDELANLGEGATDKILGPTGRQNFGPLAFNALCGTYAIKFIAVRDVEQEKIMAPHWADGQRQTSHARTDTHRMSKILIERAKPHVFKELAQLATIGRKRIPRAERVKIARKAIVTRWRNKRRMEREAKQLKSAQAGVTG